MSGEITEFKLVTGALTALGIAAVMLVGAPYFLLHNLAPPPALKAYNAQQLRGRAVYISNGCLYCHSQQPRDPA